MLGASTFCAAPRGVTPWTIHLYVAMHAGCIPVRSAPAAREGCHADILWAYGRVSRFVYRQLILRGGWVSGSGSTICTRCALVLFDGVDMKLSQVTIG